MAASFTLTPEPFPLLLLVDVLTHYHTAYQSCLSSSDFVRDLFDCKEVTGRAYLLSHVTTTSEDTR